MREFAVILVVLSLLFVAIGCGDDSESGFSGIVETTLGSPDPISEDLEDWQPRCAAFPSEVCALPARPNPTAETTRIQFGVPVASVATIYIESAPMRRVRDLFEGRVAVGLNEIVWDLTDNDGEALPNGIYRVWITAKNQSTSESATTYGDIQIRVPADE